MDVAARPAFDLRPNRHADVDLGGVDVDEAVGLALGRSVATFQLGESGTGEHLFAAAEAAGVDAAYMDQLRAFIAEEQEHARLLGLVLDALGVPRRTSHWSDRAFVVIRRLKSLRTEVLTLLVAELVAVRYYSLLRDGIHDPALSDVFGRIHADELRHVDFHSVTLPPHLRRFAPAARFAVRVLWNALVTGTSVLVALDHRRAIGAAGSSPASFVRDVWCLRADLDHRLFD